MYITGLNAVIINVNNYTNAFCAATYEIVSELLNSPQHLCVCVVVRMCVCVCVSGVLTGIYT